jgi:hypothetical protein
VQFTEFIEAGTPDVDLLRGIIDTRNGPTKFMIACDGCQLASSTDILLITEAGMIRREILVIDK